MQIRIHFLVDILNVLAHSLDQNAVLVHSFSCCYGFILGKNFDMVPVKGFSFRSRFRIPAHKNFLSKLHFGWLCSVVTFLFVGILHLGHQVLIYYFLKPTLRLLKKKCKDKEITVNIYKLQFTKVTK